DVADNRRLTLWVAFALVLLGAMGIEQLGRAGAWLRAGPHPPFGHPLPGGAGLGLAVALGLLALSAGIGQAEPHIRARALAHYAQAAADTPGADPTDYRVRAERQVRLTLTFVPRYLMLAGAHVLGLVGLGVLWRRGRVSARVLRPTLLGLTL